MVADLVSYQQCTMEFLGILSPARSATAVMGVIGVSVTILCCWAAEQRWGGPEGLGKGCCGARSAPNLAGTVAGQLPPNSHCGH